MNKMVLHLHMGNSTGKRSTPFLKALTPIISLAFIGVCIQFYRANNGFTAIHFSFILTALILLVTAFLIFGGKKKSSRFSTSGVISGSQTMPTLVGVEIDDSKEELPDPSEHGFDVPLI